MLQQLCRYFQSFQTYRKLYNKLIVIDIIKQLNSLITQHLLLLLPQLQQIIYKNMAQQEVNQLKAKLQAQEQQFQNYKTECKQLQEFLQEESQKKQTQNRKLKEEIIKKQKGEKMMKTQISQLQAELAASKTQLQQAKKNSDGPKGGPSQQEVKKLQKLTTQNNQAKQKCQNLSKQVSQLQGQVKKQKETIKSLQQKLKSSEQKIKSAQEKLKISEQKLKASSSSNVSNSHQSSKQKSAQKSSQKSNQQLAHLKSKNQELQKQRNKLQSQLKSKEDQHKKMISEYQQKLKKLANIKQKQQKTQSKHEEIKQRKLSVGKEIRQKTVPLNQHNNKMAILQESNQQLMHKLEKFQKEIKQLKAKNKNLMDEKSQLQGKVKHQHQLLELEKQREKRQYESPVKESQIVFNDHQQMMIDDGQSSSLATACLILTKRHYISPFIELKDKNIKLFKSTKNGFQKSLGAIKHKFDSVGYDMNELVQNAATKIKVSGDGSHSVVIYGVKRTSKKYVMAELVSNLKEFLLQKIDESQNQEISATYMIKSQQQQKNYQKVSSQKEQIEQIMDKIIGLGSKQNKQKKTSKKGSKPKIRYFNITVGSFTLQIFATSYLNPFIKQGQTLVDYLNTVVFSKLPNVLQTSQSNYQIITTINPIVSLYEECKNTLSISLVPNKDKSLMATPKSDWKEWNNNQNGLNTDQLNDSAKKKLQSFEKENEQVMMKMKRVQDECGYYRNKFEELESRLKNLLNTHNQQNTYLKKSPITLSYQKMLKLVHTALSRNTNISLSRTSLVGNQAYTSGNNANEEHHYVYEQDNKSLQEAF